MCQMSHFTIEYRSDKEKSEIRWKSIHSISNNQIQFVAHMECGKTSNEISIGPFSCISHWFNLIFTEWNFGELFISITCTRINNQRWGVFGVTHSKAATTTIHKRNNESNQSLVYMFRILYPYRIVWRPVADVQYPIQSWQNEGKKVFGRK